MNCLDIITKLQQQDYVDGEFYKFAQNTDADAQSLHNLYLDSVKYDHGGVCLDHTIYSE
jgi:hypothetical protein